MSEFEIKHSWMEAESNSEVEATLCRLRLSVGGKTASTWEDEHGRREDWLECPAYYIAEWIAENWWALLWEPRKREDGADDPDFLSRHSLLAAQHGFALPKIVFVPAGQSLRIGASARQVPYADVRFVCSSIAVLDRARIEAELRSFVQAVYEQLASCGFKNTALQDCWSSVAETQDDETLFCSLMGALGLSPYSSAPAIEKALFDAVDVLGNRLAMDLCLASTAEDFVRQAEVAKQAYQAASNAPAASLAALSGVPVPPDNKALDAYRRGLRAATRIRTKLRIDDADPRGSESMFDALHIDPSLRSASDGYQDLDQPIVGAVLREHECARMALLQRAAPQRRFAAARGVFAAWAAAEEANPGRLLTSAVTRDQQANRAFAAEMTAPISFIRKRASKSRLTPDQVQELAAELVVAADVVFKQAQNNGIRVARY